MNKPREQSAPVRWLVPGISLALILAICVSVAITVRSLLPPNTQKATAETPTVIESITENITIHDTSDSNIPSYQIYEIVGTAPNITGKTWQNMLTWRKNAAQLAEQHRQRCYINGDPAEKKVYLTFDDGPDPVNTLKTMTILLENHASATFFFTGQNMQAHPDIVRQIHDNGFAIGLHGWNHRRFSELSESELRRQIEQSNTLLRDLTGKTTTLTRPPYGDVTSSVIQTLSTLEQSIYIWSIDTLDWAQKNPSQILRNISDNIRPGDIILMHSGHGQPLSAAILPEVINCIRDRGYEPAALSQN